ncbi:DUF3124 domain-containing protein [Flagellimonas sp.]|uniref:DUF3124 domain-containing protein n=1 Tax=Flagellimonas sp. TaxID=2058762 RepID=UPI003BAEF4F1
MKAKYKYMSIIVVMFLFGCEEKKGNSSVDPENWSKRAIDISSKDSLEFGKSYLSVYAQIYSINEHETHNLTSMISMRNTSESDTIYLLRAEFYDTSGKSVRKYFDFPIYLAPLETSEIIIDEIDVTGGTGSNFIFEWKIPRNCPEPLIEGIMSSTMGQQGLSFTTQAKRIE